MRKNNLFESAVAYAMTERKITIDSEAKEAILRQESFCAVCPEEILHDRAYIRCCEEKLRSYMERGIKYTSLLNYEYPSLLREIPDPPLLLYYSGDQIERLEDVYPIAVVGSRNADAHGMHIAHKIGCEVSNNHGVTVSGLARGIDGAAHRGALHGSSSLPTIAVLGQGLLTPIYPAGHRKLAREILDSGGLLVSHFLPEQAPLPHHFLDRNRIISGLSRATVVVQAPKKSGALSTARHANEQGREVLVVPGLFESYRYEGAHRLIQQGATLIHRLEDLFSELSLNRIIPGPSDNDTVLSAPARQLFSYLRQGVELSYEELQKACPAKASFEELLLELELCGRIKRLPGMRIIAS